MEKRKKRARGPKWNHAQTMALAELKREASLNKEYGRLVWERIAQTHSCRFPGQIRTGAQCRRRWDTLVKVYNHIEDYCVVTGAQDHRELKKGELVSMKLDTAYQQDWYDIVEQVCSQRKRKERRDRDLMLSKRIKESRTISHSVELPERPPNRDTLASASTSKSVTPHEQSTLESTTAYAQVSSSPSLEDKLSPEEVLRYRNENDGLVLEVTGQHGQVSHEVSQEPQTLESTNLLPHTFRAENGAQLKEPLQDDFWAWFDDPQFEASAEIEQLETESELTEPFDWDSESVLDAHFGFPPSYGDFDLVGPGARPGYGGSDNSTINSTRELEEFSTEEMKRCLPSHLNHNHLLNGKLRFISSMVNSSTSLVLEEERRKSRQTDPLSDHDIMDFLTKRRLNDL